MNSSQSRWYNYIHPEIGPPEYKAQNLPPQIRTHLTTFRITSRITMEYEITPQLKKDSASTAKPCLKEYLNIKSMFYCTAHCNPTFKKNFNSSTSEEKQITLLMIILL